MLWLLATPFAILALAGVVWFSVGYARFARYHRHKGLERRKVAFLPYALREGIAILTLGLWHLRAAFSDGLRTPARVTGPPVLCLHVITQTGSNLWGIRKALEARGRPTRAMSLGRFPGSRRRLGDLLAPEVERLAAISPTGLWTSSPTPSAALCSVSCSPTVPILLDRSATSSPWAVLTAAPPAFGACRWAGRSNASAAAPSCSRACRPSTPTTSRP